MTNPFRFSAKGRALVDRLGMSGAPGTLVTLVLAVAISYFVGTSYNRLGFWAVVGVLVAAAASIFLFSSARALILVIFVAKPIVDMLWSAGVSFGGVSLNPQSILSVVILFASLMFLVTRRVEVPRALLAPTIVLLLSNVWALAMTSDKAFGGEYLIRIVCGFPLLFVVPAVVKYLPPPRIMLRWFFIVMGVVFVTVLLQPLGVLPYTSFDDPGVGRATGFYYHPWDVARYIVVAVPLLLVAIDERGRHRIAQNWPYWTLLTLALITTYFTFLKAVWIAVVLQIVLWLLLTGRGRAAIVLLAATVLLVAFPLRQGFTSVFYDLWKLSDDQTRGQALSGRVFLWGEYWKGLQHSRLGDILLGQGYRPSVMGATNRATHDDYLRLLVMNGIAGLCAYFWLLTAVIRSLRKSVARLAERKGMEWRIGLAVICLLAAYMLMGLTADPSSYPSLTLYLWLLVGLVLGYAQEAGDNLERVEP